MLYKQIRTMYLIKYLKIKKEPNIASILGIHPYTAKILSKSCDIYTLDKLKEIMYSFDEYDEKTKKRWNGFWNRSKKNNLFYVKSNI